MKDHLTVWLILCSFLMATNAQTMGLPQRYNGDVWRYIKDVRSVGDVRQLLDDGFNINATDQNGSTILHFAAFSNKVSIAKLVISAGISLGTLDKYGNTALDYAVRNNYRKLAMIIAAAMVYKGIELPKSEEKFPKSAQVGESLALKVLRAERTRSEYPIVRTRDEAEIIEFLKTLAIRSRI